MLARTIAAWVAAAWFLVACGVLGHAIQALAERMPEAIRAVLP